MDRRDFLKKAISTTIVAGSTLAFGDVGSFWSSKAAAADKIKKQRGDVLIADFFQRPSPM